MNALQNHDAAILEDYRYLIGIDEAGRGCLAGPVVAGACVLRAEFFRDTVALARSAGINDSKQLTGEARAAQYAILLELQGAGWLDFEVAEGSVAEIAAHNILGANRLAMRRAVEGLASRHPALQLPEEAGAGPLFDGLVEVCVLVDGRPLKPWPYAHRGIVKGDGQSLAIAMASIAAKVRRDGRMHELALRYPAYGFGQHKGYATQAHRSAIRSHGPCPEHRDLFLRKVLQSDG